MLVKLYAVSGLAFKIFIALNLLSPAGLVPPNTTAFPPRCMKAFTKYSKLEYAVSGSLWPKGNNSTCLFSKDCFIRLVSLDVNFVNVYFGKFRFK